MESVLSEQKYQKILEENTRLKEENAYLRFELAELKRLIFGQKRERYIPGDNNQTSLFGDDEAARNSDPEKDMIR